MNKNSMEKKLPVFGVGGDDVGLPGEKQINNKNVNQPISITKHKIHVNKTLR